MILLFLLLPALLFASGNPVQKTEARVPGTIDFGSESKDVIIAPNKVKAGKDFEVKIATVGGGCEREGDVSVILGENTASLFVYDFTTATQPNVACTMIMKRLEHSATLNFTKPGEAIIRVWGRRIGSDTPAGGEPMILEKKITVE
jgi:hypothetical protein